MISLAACLLFLWSCWLFYRWQRMIDPQKDGMALRDERRWLLKSWKWLGVALCVLFCLRMGCYSCEACAFAEVATAGESWRSASAAGSAEFWRVWRHVWDVAIGVW